MARHYTIGGLKLYRRSIIKLTVGERQSLATLRQVTVRRAVEWPLVDRTPRFERAFVDPGGTDLWGPGPYLKVPTSGGDDQYEAVNRVLCPWGYPPDRVRISRSPRYLDLVGVGLVRDPDGGWSWIMDLKPAAP
jgi:hypothetical protein